MKITDNEYKYSIITLAFCSAFTHFTVSAPYREVYSAERIYCIAISVFLSLFVAILIDRIDFNKNVFRYSALSIIVFRMIYTVCRYVQYYQTFYGEGAVGIIFLTAVVMVLLLVYKNSNIKSMYYFFLVSNLLIGILVLIMSTGLMNTANIYSNYVSIRGNYDTVFVFFDVFTIAVILKDKKDRRQVQKRFLSISAVVFAAVTLLQGLCIKGDLLYSISPLQSLVQVFSGETVKRYDYVFNILFTINYFGAVVLYGFTIRELINKEKSIENS